MVVMKKFGLFFSNRGLKYDQCIEEVMKRKISAQ